MTEDRFRLRMLAGSRLSSILDPSCIRGKSDLYAHEAHEHACLCSITLKKVAILSVARQEILRWPPLLTILLATLFV